MDFPSGQPTDVAALIRHYPLAWLATCGEAGFDAVPLPLVAETDDVGVPVALVGHCSRRNAQVAALRRDPRAWALFMGPQGYISPSLISRPQWVPTWNYAVAVFALEVELLEDETESAVNLLVEASEADRPRPWRIAEAGERVPGMMQRIIGFRGRILASDVRFKLGQDEDDLTVNEIIAGLRDGELAQWMRRFNAGRIDDAAGEGRGRGMN